MIAALEIVSVFRQTNYMDSRAETILEIVREVAEMRRTAEEARLDGATIGFVPTMGALHEGHLSLMRRAARECALTVASVFVNPLQFAPGEDFDAYPRLLDHDVVQARDADVAMVFAPTAGEMYASRPLTKVHVSQLDQPMEGALRPGHFDGVATVVAKLFNIVGACKAYFGEKDFQQLAIVKRMVFDLNFPVEVVACPIVRENDGLAMSSRNQYLTSAERQAAPILYQALTEAIAMVGRGQRDASRIVAEVSERVKSEPLAKLDYVQVVDATTMQALNVIQDNSRLLVAARFGKARLIDNVAL